MPLPPALSPFVPYGEREKNGVAVYSESAAPKVRCTLSPPTRTSQEIGKIPANARQFFRQRMKLRAPPRKTSVGGWASRPTTLVRCIFCFTEVGSPLSFRLMKTSTRFILLLVVVVALFLSSRSSFAAYQLFLKIDGIDGESTDNLHKNEIEAMTFSQDVFQGVPGFGGGGGAGKSQFSDFTVTKLVDKASPQLLLASASGNHIKKATLVVRQVGGGTPVEYYKITITDLLVTGVKISGDTGQTSNRPKETVSFNFGQIEWEYRPIKPDGSLGAPIRTGWNLKTNTKV